MNGLRAWCLLLLLPWLAEAEALRLVADPWPPFTDRTLPGNGVASELVSTALGRAGYRTRYAEVPWARATYGLQRAEYDVLINAWYSDGRAEYGHFSAPYLINRIRFLQRKGANIRFERLADLYPYRIVVVRGYAYADDFDGDPGLTRIGSGNFASAARMLHRGRVHLAVEDEFVALHHFSRELADIRDQLEFLPKPLSENGLHILIRRSHPDHRRLAQAFDQAIEAMRADGSYAEILARHGLGRR